VAATGELKAAVISRTHVIHFEGNEIGQQVNVFKKYSKSIQKEKKKKTTLDKDSRAVLRLVLGGGGKYSLSRGLPTFNTLLIK